MLKLPDNIKRSDRVDHLNLDEVLQKMRPKSKKVLFLLPFGVVGQKILLFRTKFS